MPDQLHRHRLEGQHGWFAAYSTGHVATSLGLPDPLVHNCQVLSPSVVCQYSINEAHGGTASAAAAPPPAVDPMLLPYVPASTLDDAAPSAAASTPIGVRSYTAGGGSETVSLPVYAVTATPGGHPCCLISCADSRCPAAAHSLNTVCLKMPHVKPPG